MWPLCTLGWPHKVEDRLPVPTGVESSPKKVEDCENNPQAELIACQVEKDDFIIVVFEFRDEALLLSLHHG